MGFPSSSCLRSLSCATSELNASWGNSWLILSSGDRGRLLPNCDPGLEVCTRFGVDGSEVFLLLPLLFAHTGLVPNVLVFNVHLEGLTLECSGVYLCWAILVVHVRTTLCIKRDAPIGTFTDMSARCNGSLTSLRNVKWWVMACSMVPCTRSPDTVHKLT